MLKMSEERLTKREWETKEAGRMRRGSQILRWKDNFKKHLKRAGENSGMELQNVVLTMEHIK